MASFDLTETDSRAQFFRQTVLTNIHYWQAWLEPNMNNAVLLDRESSAIVKAISFALKSEEAWSSVFELVTTLSPLMERRGHWDMWHWVLTRSLEVARRLEDGAGEVTLSALLARLLFQQSRFKEATTCYRRTIQLARQMEDQFNEARACTNLGYYFIVQGHWYRAEVLCCLALELFEQLDSDHGRAHTENHLGILYTQQGQWVKAEQHLEQACAIWEEIDDQHGLMRGFVNLCLLYNSMKLPDKALAVAEKAFRQAKITGEELETGRIHLNVGTAYKFNGKLEEAEVYTRKAQIIFRRLSNIHGLINVLNNLGEIYLLRREWASATMHLIEALQGYRQLKNKHGEVQTIIHLANCELLQDHYLQAQSWLEDAEYQLKHYPQAGRYNQLPEQIKIIRRSLAEKTPSSYDVSTKSA
jgi:tetratricopeptide (TPR) repeat protein